MFYDEAIPMLRYLINDIDSATYSDSRLRTQLNISARYVNVELFNNSYTVSVIGSGSISPDPTDAPRDENFINLVVLRAGCDVGRNEFKLAAGQAISIKDGSSALDLKGTADQKNIVSQSLCKLYSDAKMEFSLSGGAEGTIGAAIFSTYNFTNYTPRLEIN